MGTIFSSMMPLFLLVMFWSVAWKGLALWHAARRGEKWWFLAMLIINLLGILEIIYLFAVVKINKQDSIL